MNIPKHLQERLEQRKLTSELISGSTEIVDTSDPRDGLAPSVIDLSANAHMRQPARQTGNDLSPDDWPPALVVDVEREQTESLRYSRIPELDHPPKRPVHLRPRWWNGPKRVWSLIGWAIDMHRYEIRNAKRNACLDEIRARHQAKRDGNKQVRPK